MGKMFFSILLILVLFTIGGFVLGYYNIAYSAGFLLGSIALGVGFLYSSKDDRYRNNYL